MTRIRFRDVLKLPRNIYYTYLGIFMLRLFFYLSLAILQNPRYLSVSGLERFLIFVPYPAAELLTVSFFGSLCDRIGRKPIFVVSFLLDALAIFFYAFTKSPVLLPLISALFGMGAAASVTSSLVIISDISPPELHGSTMGIYDAMALAGLGGGFGGGFILMEVAPSYARTAFLLGAFVLIGMALFSYLIIQETFENAPKKEENFAKALIDDVVTVLKDKDVQHILPVWIPVICLYGIVLNFSEQLAHDLELNSEGLPLLIVLASIGLAIFVGFPLHGYLSDKFGRKPFLILGMFSFAAFISLLVYASTNNLLLQFAPLLFLLGLGCGAFPPAALALLADIVEKEHAGATMGSYSVVYGIGLILGPFLAGVTLDKKIPGIPPSYQGLTGLIILVWLLGIVSIIGTLYLPDHLAKKHVSSTSVTSVPSLK